MPSPRSTSLLPCAFLIAVAALYGAHGCAKAHDLGVTSESSTTSSSAAAASGSTTAGGGDGGAAASSSSGIDFGGGGPGGAGGAGTGGTGDIDAGPPKPTKLTILNGVNDYDAVRICFLPYPAGDPSAMPWPAAAAGLLFGRAEVIDPIGSVIPAGVDVWPHLIAGELGLAAGKTCDQVMAAAKLNPGLFVVPLSVIPAPVFDSNKSLLIATTGCIGGPGHEGGIATVACGFSYTAATPTVGLVVVGMSRDSDPGNVSMQVLNASAPLQPMDIKITPGYDASAASVIVPALSFGAIGPLPPAASLSLADLGPLDKVVIGPYGPGQMTPSSLTKLTESFALGTVKSDALVDGANYVFVAVGSYPGISPGPWWHGLTFTLISADP